MPEMQEASSPVVISRPQAVLDPIERSSEILFGLIMALTFTTTFEVATAGRADVRTMLVGALGCNLAWGVVDGVMFVVTRSIEKQRFRSRLLAVQLANPEDAPHILAQELPDGWASLLDAHDLGRLAERARMAAAPPAVPLTAQDVLGGFAVLGLVFLATFPVAVPFLIFENLHLAARVSDATGLVMLFVIGYRLGSHAGRRPLGVALIMVAIGLLLCGLAIRLGG